MNGLLLIDVQNDYFPGGHCELEGADAALENIRKVLERYRKEKLPVIHVQHLNTRPGAGFFLPGTAGAEIHRHLTPQQGEAVVVKHMPNSFFQTNLLELIHNAGIDMLTVCGMMTHMCVDTTVRAAKDYDIPITLLYDACATRELQGMGNTIPAEIVHDAYMAGLSGMFANVILTEQYLV